ncbi:TPA: hypothetical protein QDB14_002549 [Burkholderia vietnamiensis]|nr:hypothetical protein [Burkholderia vietnamiensis]HEP6274479.1 hypothetical protein [Burkholderia vietnamiensis]HEP6283978.1 hypothetical protein [Burkholderia vietnamiensis]HEP6309444.1 hypothetical protein [Burkholderia vietnamiensis]
MFDLSSIAHQAQSQFAPIVHVKRTHVMEILAAMLGCHTYAAFLSEENAPGAASLSGVQHVILQSESALSRATGLGLSSTHASLLVEALGISMRSRAPKPGPRVHLSVSDFCDNHLREFMERAALDSDAVASESAGTNAYISDSTIEEFTFDPELLKAKDGFWLVTGHGLVDMDQDTERPFSGDRINVIVRAPFEVSRRVGVIQGLVEVDASLDDSWYDASDYDDDGELLT